jgi:hypothetical protein
MRPWRVGVAIAGVVAALVAAPLAACASELLAATAQQMDCCLHEQHDCDGPAMEAADCCTHSNSRPSQLNSTRTEPTHSSPVLLFQSVHPAATSLNVLAVSRAVAVPDAPDTGPPDCISFSVLLI